MSTGVSFFSLLRSVDGAALLACDYVALTRVTNTVRSAGLHGDQFWVSGLQLKK